MTGVEDYAYASSLDYAGALSKWARREFRCASAVGQVEAVRAGIGIGILHDFAARSVPDLVRILPSLSFGRAYYLLSHPDTHNLARIALCREHLVRRFKDERRRFDFEAASQ